jgi:hypothetical protein
MEKIVEMLFGSHLYGLSTPESDEDRKGVYWPTEEDLLLGRIKKSIHESTGAKDEKNKAGDVDTEFYSLQYFVKLACEGQTVALDMLHAPEDVIIERSPAWNAMVSHRSKFYTKNLKAFVGYARRQAAKYGIKGSRLATARRVFDVFTEAKEWNNEVTVGAIVSKHGELLGLEHIHADDQHFEVCGKKLQWNARVKHYITSIQMFIDEFGDRARQAEKSEGVDWKAMSHALRAGFQVRHILKSGTYSYPLPESDFLFGVKMGRLDYPTVAQRLEDLMDECDELTAVSKLPNKVDIEWWEAWLIDQLKDHYNWRPFKARTV